MASKYIFLALSLIVFCSLVRADQFNWSDCKTFIGGNTVFTWYEYEKPLVPLLDDELHHVTRRTSGDRLDYLQMKLGLEAEYKGTLILSPTREPKDKGFFFYIGITAKRVYLESHNTGTDKSVYQVIKTDTVMDSPKPAALYLTITNGTRLEMRHELNGAPFLQYDDERFGDIKYMGLGSSTFNSRGHATLYYDC